MAEEENENLSFPRQRTKQKPSLPQRLLPLRTIPSLSKNPLSGDTAKEAVKVIMWALIRPYLWTIIGIILAILVVTFFLLVALIHVCKLTPILSTAANAIPGIAQICAFFPDFPGNIPAASPK